VFNRLISRSACRKVDRGWLQKTYRDWDNQKIKWLIHEKFCQSYPGGTSRIFKVIRRVVDSFHPLLLQNKAWLDVRPDNASLYVFEALLERCWNRSVLEFFDFFENRPYGYDKQSSPDLAAPEADLLLSVAAICGSIDLVKLLLVGGANVLFQSEHFPSALYAAALKGNVPLVSLLLEYNAPVNAFGGLLGTPLQAAARSGSMECVVMLLNAGAYITPCASTRGALALAVISGDLAMVRCLLQYGADPTEVISGEAAKRWFNICPLSGVAASLGHLDVVREFMDHGVSCIHLRDGDDLSPLDLAVNQGHESVARLLMSKMSHEEYQYQQRSFLPAAAAGGAEALVNIALQMACMPRSRYSFTTPILMAARHGHASVVTLLLDYAAKILPLSERRGMYVDWGGLCERSPLRAAIEAGHDTVVRLLIVHNASHLAKPLASLIPSAFRFAARAGKVSTMKLLLEYGTVPVSSQWDLGSPLFVAPLSRSLDAMKFLIKGRASIPNTPLERISDTLISRSVEACHLEGVKLLFDIQPDLEVEWGSLNLAVSSRGSETMLRLLLDKGADVSEYLWMGKNLAHEAAVRGHASILRILVRQCPDLALKEDTSGFRPIHLAARHDHWEALDFLARLEKPDNYYLARKLLHLAVGRLDLSATDDRRLSPGAYKSVYFDEISDALPHGNEYFDFKKYAKDVVNYLLSSDGNLLPRSKSGASHLHSAASDGDANLVRILTLHGADVMARDDRGNTPLHCAALQGHWKAAQYLLFAGADQDAENLNGHTAESLVNELITSPDKRNGVSVGPYHHTVQRYLKMTRGKSTSEIGFCIFRPEFRLGCSCHADKPVIQYQSSFSLDW
jgi:ankyrin repeat protein